MDPCSTAVEAVDRFGDIAVTIEARFEERLMKLREVLSMQADTVVPLGRPAGETLHVFVDNVFLASAEIIVIDDQLALRITEFERLDP